MNNTTNPVEKSAVQIVKESIIAKKAAEKEERILKLLKTETGMTLFVNSEDSVKLSAIKSSIEEHTDKPVYGGFTFDENTESIIAIAGALQFAKADTRENLAEYYEVFTPSMRDLILDSTGSLPYTRDAIFLDIQGTIKVVNQDEIDESAKGIRANLEALTVACQIIQNDLDLIGELDITQEKYDRAWRQAIKKIEKQKLLDNYANELEDEEDTTDEEYLAQL